MPPTPKKDADQSKDASSSTTSSGQPIPDATITPADPEASQDVQLPASLDPDVVQSAPSPLHPDVPAIEDTSAVTMADVAALNGIGLAPDQSGRADRGDWTVEEAQKNGVFISAGMASDLEQQGFTIDPANGRRIFRQDYLEKTQKGERQETEARKADPSIGSGSGTRKA